MAASSRGVQAVSALLRGPSRRLCSQCASVGAQHLPYSPLVTRRLYSDTPGAAIQPPSPATAEPITDTPGSTSRPLQTPASTPSYRIRSGVILTRAPLLTRELTSFEAAFFLYQKRLNERLTGPFRKAQYFRPDTPAALDWRLKVRERHGVAARDIGRYNPAGRMAWNDELLVGSPTSDPGHGVVDRLLQDAVMRVSEDGEQIPPEERAPVEKLMPRRTEADEKGDCRRLDRALDRTLYLVVRKGGENAPWEFPSGDVLTHEALHETAARVLEESAGVNMNTWIVGRVPVAHYVVEPQQSEAAENARGHKIFFLKGRIMAGQADLANNRHGLTDFKWLTKEELEKELPEDYYFHLRGMMADR